MTTDRCLVCGSHLVSALDGRAKVGEAIAITYCPTCAAAPVFGGGPPAPDAPTPTDAECAAAKYAEACELLQAVFHREPCCDLLPYGHSVVDEGIPALEAEVERLRALLAAGTPQPTDGLAAFFPPSPKARVSEPGPIRTEAAEVVATVRATARALGYAVALHGSMRRDLDLIAAPWTDEAVPPEELAEAVRVAVGGYWRAAHPDPYVEIGGSEPATRAHGRLAWSIYGVLGTYLDLSIMPPLRAVVPPPPDTAAAPTERSPYFYTGPGERTRVRLWLNVGPKDSRWLEVASLTCVDAEELVKWINESLRVRAERLRAAPATDAAEVDDLPLPMATGPDPDAEADPTLTDEAFAVLRAEMEAEAAPATDDAPTKDRSQTATRTDHNALTRRAAELCWEIERLPSGEQQTRLSGLASSLLRAIYLGTPEGHPDA